MIKSKKERSHHHKSSGKFICCSQPPQLPAPMSAIHFIELRPICNPRCHPEGSSEFLTDCRQIEHCGTAVKSWWMLPTFEQFQYHKRDTGESKGDGEVFYPFFHFLYHFSVENASGTIVISIKRSFSRNGVSTLLIPKLSFERCPK